MNTNTNTPQQDATIFTTEAKGRREMIRNTAIMLDHFSAGQAIGSAHRANDSTLLLGTMLHTAILELHTIANALACLMEATNDIRDELEIRRIQSS